MSIGFSPQTAAAAFDPPLSAKSVKEALRSGALRAHRVGNRSVVLADDLIAWIRDQPNYRATRKLANG